MAWGWPYRRISGIEETSELVISEVQFILSNVPENVLHLASADVRGRRASVWWAGITLDKRVVPDPVMLTDVELDYWSTTAAEDGTHTISLFGLTGFWVLERPSDRSWTPEEQATRYPDDTGFDKVAGLVDNEITWTPT